MYDKLSPPKYDKVVLPVEKEVPVKPEIPKCEHVFNDNLELITEYTDGLCEKVIRHGQEGYIIESFCGRFGICSKTFNTVWLDRERPEYAKFRSAVKTSMSAVIYYFNAELIHAIKNYDTLGSSINVLKGIISDFMKSTPKALRDLQFEDVNAQETEEERKHRLDNEAKEKSYAAFKNGANIDA